MASNDRDSTVQQYQNLTTDNIDLPSETSSVTNHRHAICCAEHSSSLINSSSTAFSHLRFQNRINVDSATESNHDTPLTLACTGGHEALVLLLLQRNANLEHRDKKGFTPLILSGKCISHFTLFFSSHHTNINLATAGHAGIVSRLIEHGANIEAQSERTKDTALSLACSGGRQDVVEVLLKKGANREHRNVSDYTGR